MVWSGVERGSPIAFPSRCGPWKSVLSSGVGPGVEIRPQFETLTKSFAHLSAKTVSGGK